MLPNSFRQPYRQQTKCLINNTLLNVNTWHVASSLFNGMGIDPFVDFLGEWALLALGYTQPLQHFHSHLVIMNIAPIYRGRWKLVGIGVLKLLYSRPVFTLLILKNHRAVSSNIGTKSTSLSFSTHKAQALLHHYMYRVLESVKDNAAQG